MAIDVGHVVLGERPCLELVNTVVGPIGQHTDVLADEQLAVAWIAALAATTPDEGVPVVREVTRSDLEQLHLLRGAVDQVLDGAPRASSLSVINRIESEASPSWSLDLDGAGRIVVHRRLWGDGVEALLGVIAADAVDLVRSGHLEDVRRCPGPGCTLRFLPLHHRRRFCRPACGQRARQAAYYRRSRGRDTQ